MTLTSHFGSKPELSPRLAARFTSAPKIAELEHDQIVTIPVRVVRHEPGMGRRPYRVQVEDDTGALTLVYFNVKGDHLVRLLPAGAERIVSGRVVRCSFWARVASHARYNPKQPRRASGLERRRT